MQSDQTNKNPQPPPNLSNACVTNHPWGDRSVPTQVKCGNWSQEKELPEVSVRKPWNCSGRGWFHHTEVAAWHHHKWGGIAVGSALNPVLCILHLEGGTKSESPSIAPLLPQAPPGQGWSNLHGLGRCSLVSKPMIMKQRNSNRCGFYCKAQFNDSPSFANHLLAFQSHTWSQIMTHGQGYGSGRAKNLQKSKLLLPCPPFLAGENFLTLQTPLMCLTGHIVTSTLDLRRFIRQLFPERLIQKTTTPPPPFETGTVFAGLRSLLDKCSTKPK